MRLASTTLGAAIAIVLCAAPSGGAAAPTTIVSNVPVAGAVQNPCNGEVVSFSGTIQTVFHTAVDGAGAVHVSNLSRSFVRGTGAATGTSYTSTSVAHGSSFTAADGSPSAITDTLSFLLVGQGSTPNFLFSVTQHLTIDANGIPHAEVIAVRSTCLG